MKTAIWAASMVLAGSAYAALPPYAESARIIQAIVENDAVASTFGMAHSIEKIERFERGYRVFSSGGCSLEVEVVYRHQPMPGASAFHLKLGAFTCSAQEPIDD